MKKSEAIKLLGGTPTTAAAAVGITVSAVSQWPDELPQRIVDRVLAALARRHLPPEMLGDAGQAAKPADLGPTSQPGALDEAEV